MIRFENDGQLKGVALEPDVRLKSHRLGAAFADFLTAPHHGHGTQRTIDVQVLAGRSVAGLLDGRGTVMAIGGQWQGHDGQR